MNAFNQYALSRANNAQENTTFLPNQYPSNNSDMVKYAHQFQANNVHLFCPDSIANNIVNNVSFERISAFSSYYATTVGLPVINLILTGYSNQLNFRFQSQPFIYNGQETTLIIYMDDGLINVVSGKIRG